MQDDGPKGRALCLRLRSIYRYQRQAGTRIALAKQAIGRYTFSKPRMLRAGSFQAGDMLRAGPTAHSAYPDPEFSALGCRMCQKTSTCWPKRLILPALARGLGPNETHAEGWKAPTRRPSLGKSWPSIRPGSRDRIKSGETVELFPDFSHNSLVLPFFFGVS